MSFVESSSRVLPTGSDSSREGEKIVVVVAAVGHRLWLLIAVPERDGRAGTGRQKWGASQKGGSRPSASSKVSSEFSCFLRGEEKKNKFGVYI